MTFWLDAQDKSKFNSDSFQKNRGNLAVAINEWGKFFDVRLNQIELRAGTGGLPFMTSALRGEGVPSKADIVSNLSKGGCVN